MNIQGGLIDGSVVQIQFYSESDVRATEFSDEPLPQSWAAVQFDESEARDLVEWLNGDRSSSWQARRRTVSASADSLVIDGRDAGFSVRLSSVAEIESFVRAISSTLALIVGRPVKAH